MTRPLTFAHLGALLVLLAFFLPVVAAPLVTAAQREASPLPAGFAVWDLVRLHGVGSLSWHALLVLAIGGLGVVMAFTGPHRGLWIPAAAWLIGITVELRLFVGELQAPQGAAESWGAGIAPWGWAVGFSGALLMVLGSLSELAARREPQRVPRRRG